MAGVSMVADVFTKLEMVLSLEGHDGDVLEG